MQTRNARGLHRLSVTSVKFATKPGWYADGGGLYLEVDRGGAKRWAMRLTVGGRRRDFGLGPIHKVSLQDAREMAADYRAKAYRGVDPIADKKARRIASKPSLSFEAAAEQVHRIRTAAWSNGKHVDQWINSLRDYAFPVIGSRPVAEVTTPDVLAILTPIWIAKPETARRVRQRLSTVLEWARAAGHRQGDNPVDLIGDALPRHKKVERHHAALPYAQVSRFIARLRAGPSAPMTKLAFEFLILTAARSKEARHALWSEIDCNEALWTIPGDDASTGRRMKSGREHVVPLSPRCLEILRAARQAATGGLLFPDDATGKPMSENRFLNARDSIGYDKSICSPHGFRLSFRDWAAEETSFPSDVAEMALAHQIKSKVEAAYRRGQLLAKRRELMDAWAQFALPRSAPA